LHDALGDYADDLPFSSLESSRFGSSIPNDIAKLTGRRFVTSSETSEGTKLNEGRVKAITGRDVITARFMRREYFTFQPQFVLWLSVNHLPRVSDTSLAFWARVKPIPFLRKFEGDDAQQDLPDVLKREAEGILAWAVEGAKNVYQLRATGKSLPEPEAMRKDREDYRSSQNGLGEFAAERLRKVPGARTRSSEVTSDYMWWAGHNGLDFKDRVKQPEFKDRMKALGFESKRLSDAVFYLDCELVPEPPVGGIQVQLDDGTVSGF